MAMEEKLKRIHEIVNLNGKRENLSIIKNN
jgi:hypothetical protein